MENVRNEWSQTWGDADFEIDMRNMTFETKTREVLRQNFGVKDKILEAGCGFGRYSILLEKKSIRTIGIDIARNALIKGLAHAKAINVSPVFIVGDVTHLPFRDNTFNGYISLGVIEHFRSRKDLGRTFREASRVLHRGGIAYFTGPNLFKTFAWRVLSKMHRYVYHGFCPKRDLIAHALKNGFQIEDVGEHGSWETLYYFLTSLLKVFKPKIEWWTIKTTLMKALSFLDMFPISKIIGTTYIIGCTRAISKKRTTRFRGT